MECIGNSLGLKCHKWGFVVFNWLLTIDAITQTVFKQIIFESYAKNAHIAKPMKPLFLQLIVSLITSMCDTTNLEERKNFLAVRAQTS